MISIRLNGKIVQLIDACSLDMALKQWGYKGRSFAVAINQNVIVREDYTTTILKANDRVDIIMPMQGG